MTSEVVICNMALTALGSASGLNTGFITSLTDNTREAQLCNLWYAPLRDAVLQDGAWTFATKRAALVPDADPPEWGYSTRFSVPNNTLQVIEVYEDPHDPQPTIKPWEYESGKILCDLEQVWIRYLHREEDTTRFSSLFIQALSFRLAAELAVPIVQSRALMGEMEAKYQDRLANALNIDGMQGQARRVQSRGRMTVSRGAYYGRGIRR